MWVKLDDEFYDHPKWVGAPGDSIALWVAMIAWCNRNDSIEGFIPTVKTRGLVNVRNLKATIADLCGRGDPPVLRAVPDGYLLHDYVEYQQPEKVREIAAKRAEAGKRGATKRWGTRLANEMASGMANAMANAIASGNSNRQGPNDKSVANTRILPTSNPPVDNDVPTLELPGHPSNGMAKRMASAIANECPVPVPDNYLQSETSSRPPTADDKMEERIEAIANAVVTWRISGRPISNQPAYRAKAVPAVVLEHGPRIRELIALFPFAPIDSIVHAIETGETRGLAMFADDEPPPVTNVVDMPARKLNGEERLAALQAGGAPVRLTGKHTEAPL